jgi:hypothetical protein
MLFSVGDYLFFDSLKKLNLFTVVQIITTRKCMSRVQVQGRSIRNCVAQINSYLN